MATQKSSNHPHALAYARQEMQARRAANPVVAERWYVIEEYPAWKEWGYYGATHPPKSVRCSGFFDTLGEAERYVDTHDPDRGATFKIKHQNKRRITTEEWVNY